VVGCCIAVVGCWLLFLRVFWLAIIIKCGSQMTEISGLCGCCCDDDDECDDDEKWSQQHTPNLLVFGVGAGAGAGTAVPATVSYLSSDAAAITIVQELHKKQPIIRAIVRRKWFDHDAIIKHQSSGAVDDRSGCRSPRCQTAAAAVFGTPRKRNHSITSHRKLVTVTVVGIRRSSSSSSTYLEYLRLV
jgi:hypothetical protein